jgi:hypothetical protein
VGAAEQRAVRGLDRARVGHAPAVPDRDGPRHRGEDLRGVVLHRHPPTGHVRRAVAGVWNITWIAGATFLATSLVAVLVHAAGDWGLERPGRRFRQDLNSRLLTSCHELNTTGADGGPMRTSTPPSWQTQAALGHAWSLATMFVPVGYAVSRTIGADPPRPALLGLAAGAACLHRLLPWLVELSAGAGALILSVLAAADDRWVGPALGLSGVGVVFVFGGIVAATSFVRLLGSGRPREAAKHLVAGAAALELSLVLRGPVSGLLGASHGTVARTLVLASLLVTGTLVGAWSQLGFPLLGLGLLVAHGAFAASGVPEIVPPHVGLLGSTTFAFMALWLRSAGRLEVDRVASWPSGRRAKAA